MLNWSLNLILSIGLVPVYQTEPDKETPKM